MNRLFQLRRRLALLGSRLLTAALPAHTVRTPAISFLPTEPDATKVERTEVQVRLPAWLIVLRSVSGTPADSAVRMDSLETSKWS